ncbi:hypothetical protein Dsin_005375 [Dipteronia sinensis]|uniref:Protein FAR1-RELATED SEQUENCE n=1 Tax=Dipteronia sinensis TaxID=43782 RepID=A0AAE0AX57_9ROSI|nr:hypothetical protein Dsin_005375 [Dipteronia sinensis]
MEGKKPKSVITDGDKAMRKAQKKVMSESVHRLCCWHLERNAQSNIQDINFTDQFKHFLLNDMSIEKFDSSWLNFIETFNSTQRCENMNSYLHRFLSYKFKIYEFIHQIDRALARIRNIEAQNAFDSKNGQPVLSTHLHLYEQHATKVFSRYIFLMVRDEIKAEASLVMTECVQETERHLYQLTKFCNMHLTWSVIFYPTSKYIKCSCKLYENVGIPCRHSFFVMKVEHLGEIPSSLIMHRWTKDVKCGFDLNGNNLEINDKVSETVRHGALGVLCNKICYFASKTDIAYREARPKLESLAIRMEELFLNEKTTTSVNETSICNLDIIKDPVVVVTKGDGNHKSKKKRQRQCGKCKEVGHTIKTCRLAKTNYLSGASSNSVHPPNTSGDGFGESHDMNETTLNINDKRGLEATNETSSSNY